MEQALQRAAAGLAEHEGRRAPPHAARTLAREYELSPALLARGEELKHELLAQPEVGAGAAGVAAPAAARPVSSVAFLHGVASGDPRPDGVVIWTRVTPTDPTVRSVRVDWSVWRDDQAAASVASDLSMQITYLTGTEDVFGPNDGAATVSTVTAPDYAERCPNANRLLTSLRFTSAQEAELMQPIMDRKQPAQVARDWIKANPQVVEAWLEGVTTLDGKPANAALVAGN